MEKQKEVVQTLRDLIGTPKVKKEKYTNKFWTDKNVYIYGVDNGHIQRILDKEAMVRKHEFNGNVTGEIICDRYQIAYCHFKDGKMNIISGINGDERGCSVFNGTFIASGHDGSYLFDIDNPEDNKRHGY